MTSIYVKNVRLRRFTNTQCLRSEEPNKHQLSFNVSTRTRVLISTKVNNQMLANPQDLAPRRDQGKRKSSTMPDLLRKTLVIDILLKQVKFSSNLGLSEIMVKLTGH
jgi:hypothetical protein